MPTASGEVSSTHRAGLACENGEHLLYETRSSVSQKNPSRSRSWRIKRSVRGDTRIFLNEFTATQRRDDVTFPSIDDNARFVSFHFASFSRFVSRDLSNFRHKQESLQADRDRWMKALP